MLLSVIIALYFLFRYPIDLLAPYISKLLSTTLKSPLYVLVVGRDKNIEGTTRSDVIVLIRLDHENAHIGIANIPRDLIWKGKKINSYFAEGGVKLLKKEVEKLVGVAIDRYAVFDYESFKILGSELGPIKVVVKEPMEYYDAVQDLKINFSPGIYSLNGEQLLAYVRYRKGGLGDLDRIRRQKDVLRKLVSRLMNSGIEKIAQIYSKLSSKIETNLSSYELFYLAVKYKSGYKMEFLSFPSLLTDDGYLVINQSRLPIFKKALQGTEEFTKHEIIRVVLVNAKKRKTKMFQPIEEARWKKLVGFTPVQYVWEELGQHIIGSVAFVTSRDEKICRKIEEILKKLYTKRNFSIFWTGRLERLDEYYHYISLMSSARKYPRYPIDAIVVLGDLPE